MKTHKKKGFTLVEVMIVVAIIGLLAAIAIPNLLRARINANDGATRGDLRAFSTAAEGFRAAQGTPRYPNSMAELTGASPPYLDGTWVANTTKHGHALSYATTTDGYTLNATSVANQGNTHYCIDHTGVLYVGTASGTACPTGSPVSS